MHTQWNTTQKTKILLKWLFPLYTEVTLKSDLSFISTFLPQKKEKTRVCYLKLLLTLYS